MMHDDGVSIGERWSLCSSGRPLAQKEGTIPELATLIRPNPHSTSPAVDRKREPQSTSSPSKLSQFSEAFPLVPTSQWPRAPYQSPVPDLLFETECDQRVAELGHLRENPMAVDATTPLHRITLFLTYRCQLECSYCKTIARGPEDLLANPRKSAVLTWEQFVTMLGEHAQTPIRHLHYTGGEALLHPRMADMVRYARDRGVEHQSVTSNGALPHRLYDAIIHAGIGEIRISIDADEPELGTAFSQRASSWSKAVATIQHLARRRDQGDPFFLILNTVVTRENRQRLPQIVAFLLSLCPDDLKLITSVDEKDQLGQFRDVEAVKSAIRQTLKPFPTQAFPLLRRKLDTVFQPLTIGLEVIASNSSPQHNWRCYIPLTERTADGQNYYPCSVYLREGGAPLGAITDPQEIQRAKTVAFVMRGDCQTDPICHRYCLHCTREYNHQVNLLRKD